MIFMENIQVIDGAENTAYDIYPCTDEEFEKLFMNGINIICENDYIPKSSLCSALIKTRLTNK